MYKPKLSMKEIKARLSSSLVPARKYPCCVCNGTRRIKVRFGGYDYDPSDWGRCQDCEDGTWPKKKFMEYVQKHYRVV